VLGTYAMLVVTVWSLRSTIKTTFWRMGFNQQLASD
jgi:hypothetical protein